MSTTDTLTLNLSTPAEAVEWMGGDTWKTLPAGGGYLRLEHGHRISIERDRSRYSSQVWGAVDGPWEVTRFANGLDIKLARLVTGFNIWRQGSKPVQLGTGGTLKRPRGLVDLPGAFAFANGEIDLPATLRVNNGRDTERVLALMGYTQELSWQKYEEDVDDLTLLRRGEDSEMASERGYHRVRSTLAKLNDWEPEAWWRGSNERELRDRLTQQAAALAKSCRRGFAVEISKQVTAETVARRERVEFMDRNFSHFNR